ncbi:heterokaryon incompatibility protein-domain-containing protein [Massariosphaeria phaeospora]|uniref:Heterokaryon incompatibility protein-domain-containing protein n=1 Tax=Massariosphaeria phaeospora TaxID=100035 RepID=A0A7C8M844_9PLEO|nr:heterokaryon incompatibility protein-domain-containing protein [Massariosphaeria phaeospora]
MLASRKRRRSDGLADQATRVETPDVIANTAQVAPSNPSSPSTTPEDPPLQKLWTCRLCPSLDDGVPRWIRLNDLRASSESRACYGCDLLVALFARANVNQGEQINLVKKKGEKLKAKYESNNIWWEIFNSQERSCPWRAIEKSSLAFSTTRVEDSATRILSWLAECRSMHKPCNAAHSEPQQLPTRVLEILDEDTVQLHTSDAGEKAHYICLSHCWGKDPSKQIRTTTSNLLAHQTGITSGNLPPTFQHAVSLTFRLGIKYLWIDSLCIIQDSADDWRHEGSKMASIYSRSYLCIAASQSPNAQGGLYMTPSPWCLPHEYKLSEALGNVAGSIHARERVDHNSFKWGDMPLLRRSWFFQERALSPRVVHFGNNELYWECTATQACECSGRWPEATFGLNGTTMTHRILPTKINGSLNSDGNHLSMARNWHAMVMEYSKMELSFDKDIFPALQGVASFVMQTHRHCSYYAGLWKDNILYDLLWRRPGSTFRPETYRAPTWSWASVVGRVSWETQNETLKPRAHVLSVSTTPIGLDPLGEIASGSLRITGSGIPGRLLADGLAYHTPFEARILRRLWYPDHTSATLDVLVMSMATMECLEENFTYHFCLVFRRTDKEKDIAQYERVGICIERLAVAVDEMDWGEEMTITVV